jgi:hypothetical protein
MRPTPETEETRLASSKAKSEAEARYAKAQKRVQEAAKAMNEVEAEARRIADNTARLKALRLARDAAERASAAAAAAPPPGKGKKKAARAKSIPVEDLNASNDK